MSAAASGAVLYMLGACRFADAVRIHDLRHSYASLLINENYNDSILQKLLGHASIATTMRYAHLREDVQRKATEHVGKIRRKAVAK